MYSHDPTLATPTKETSHVWGGKSHATRDCQSLNYNSIPPACNQRNCLTDNATLLDGYWSCNKILAPCSYRLPTERNRHVREPRCTKWLPEDVVRSKRCACCIYYSGCRPLWCIWHLPLPILMRSPLYVDILKPDLIFPKNNNLVWKHVICNFNTWVFAQWVTGNSLAYQEIVDLYWPAHVIMSLLEIINEKVNNKTIVRRGGGIVVRRNKTINNKTVACERAVRWGTAKSNPTGPRDRWPTNYLQ